MHEYTITALEPQKNSKRRYNLYLDGEFKCGITEDSVAVFRLKAGQTLRKKQNMTLALMKRKRKRIGSVTKIFAMC